MKALAAILLVISTLAMVGTVAATSAVGIVASTDSNDGVQACDECGQKNCMDFSYEHRDRSMAGNCTGDCLQYEYEYEHELGGNCSSGNAEYSYKHMQRSGQE